jgi:hypothetical protein
MNKKEQEKIVAGVIKKYGSSLDLKKSPLLISA